MQLLQSFTYPRTAASNDFTFSHMPFSESETESEESRQSSEEIFDEDSSLHLLRPIRGESFSSSPSPRHH